MHPQKYISFGQFRLDFANECLWQGTRPISLRPKVFAVLKLLVENPGQLITKQQMLDAVWPGTFVGDAVLKDSIRQVREALRDDANSPAYVETAHRRGYRFIATMSGDTASRTAERSTEAPRVLDLCTQVAVSAPSCTISALGRDAELAKMREWLQLAIRGDRQVVFVTGEAGIGKTTVVEAFLEPAAAVVDLRVARGQCLEHYGAGEAYLPVLDAFSRLSRGPAAAPLLACLRQHAPTWLAQMPSLIPAAERDALHDKTLGATRERMLREIAEAMETFTADVPLVIVLEDLHWSDYSTLDLISYFARRRDPARLFVVGTYRPVDVIVSDHPLKAVKRELQAHNLCRELPLEYLSENAIADYVGARFPRHQLPRRLIRMIHRRTEGNPLFMVNAVEYLLDQKLIVEHEGTWKLSVDLTKVELGVPDSLKQLIEKQIERLSPDERTVLEGASVVGMECSAVAIAAGLDVAIEWVEKHCEELARRHQFLSPARLVELPDGTITPRHKFKHILYLEVPYSLVPPMRRSQIHHRIAERGVAIYGDHVSEIAAELAMHFEQSRDWPRALQYLCQAAENASNRSAHHEATALAGRGLEVLKSVPDTPERMQQEIKLRMILGVSLMAIKGFAAPEVEVVYKRARELCWLQGPSPQLFSMLWSLGLFYIFSGEIQSALQIAEQLLELAEGLEDLPLVMEAHRAIGVTLVDLGNCTDALEHLDQATRLYEAHRNHPYTVFIGHDCKVVSESFAARALWALGYPDRAASRMQDALTLARELSHPQSFVVAAHFATQLHQLRGEPLLALQRAKEVKALPEEYGLELWLAFGNIDHGWAEFALGNPDSGIQQMRNGLAAYAGTGGRLWRPHFLGLLANALCRTNQAQEGLIVANEALALGEKTGERYSVAELHRLKGELMMAPAYQKLTAQPSPRRSYVNAASEAGVAAQDCFAESLKIARQQGAKSWELRVLTTLGHVDQNQSRSRETLKALSETYSWFNEGWKTADLMNARTVLDGGFSQA